MVECALKYRTLLEYTAGENQRWEAWFGENPEAFNLPYAAGMMATLGGLVFHVFAVERRYAERLLERQVSTYEEMIVTGIDGVFALGRNARALFEEYLSGATDEDMRKVLTFQTLTAGTLSAPKSKIASNALLHGIRHWGQVASFLRQQGYSRQWGHDMLLTEVEA